MSASTPSLSGVLSRQSPIEVLQDLEGRRLTGYLRFEHGGVAGSIFLFGGEIAIDQEARDDGADAIDLFLELSSGTWSIQAELPPLPVSQGTESERSGSLAVHVPVDLMSYCEHAGLTGVLELTHGGRRAEAVYDAGELLAIELDGRDATDLSEVFGWEAGRFRIAIDHAAPARLRADVEEIEEPTHDGWSPAPPSKREDTRQFLRVVEMALADVLDKSEKARSPTRTSPPLPPPPKKRPRPKSIPPVAERRRRDEKTVQLIYLSGEVADVLVDDGSTRHVHVGTGQVKEKVLTGVRAERRASSERRSMGNKRRNERKAARAAAKPKREANKPQPREPHVAPSESKDGAQKGDAPVSPWRGFLGGTAWAFGALILGIVILAILAKLPPV